jgi:hypothetical protein
MLRQGVPDIKMTLATLFTPNSAAILLLWQRFSFAIALP